ncbi:tetratricopeptide repeat (TPR)-like superfamily protein [Wolffia australiana]
MATTAASPSLSPSPSCPPEARSARRNLLSQSPSFPKFGRKQISFSISHVQPTRCSISQVHNYGTVDYEKRPRSKWSSLYRRIAMTENPTVGAGLEVDKWEAEERKLSKWELCRVVKELRKFRRFKLALDVYEWMTAQEGRFNIYSSDIAIQLDLISKVRGASAAETYFTELSDSLKDKRTYGALLNSYMHAKSKEKAEEIFDLMREKDYTTDALPFNVMMTLYMNLGEHEKVESIITDMGTRGVAMDIYTYNIWITTCAARADIAEMERVFEEMNSSETINPNWTTYSTLATMYIRLGDTVKAENCLKDAELRVTGRDRLSFNYLIGLYGLIGKKDEVYRIWDWYKSSFPVILNTGYHSMLTSLVKVRDMDGAKAVYEDWKSTTGNYDPKICNIMLAWYVREGMLDKAQACLDGLIDAGGKPNPSSWEIIAAGYIREKQVSTALDCLRQAAGVERPRKWRPRLVTVSNFLVLCAEKNDNGSREGVLELLENSGCLKDEEYKSLINTYAGEALEGTGVITR